MGYPGRVIDDEGEGIYGHFFHSVNVEKHWQSLDDFEGEEY